MLINVFGNHSGFMYNLVTKTNKSHADFALLIFFISTDTVDAQGVA